MKEDKKDNVISFPENHYSKEQAQARDLRLAVGGTLAAVFLGLAGLNFSTLTEPTLNLESGGVEREIASVPKLVAPNWKKDLSGLSTDIANIAETPNNLDQLAYGRLEGRYAVAVENGMVMNLTLGDERAPVLLEQPYEFLKKFASVFTTEEKVEVKALSNRKDGSKWIKSYELISEARTSVIELEFNENKELLQLNVSN